MTKKEMFLNRPLKTHATLQLQSPIDVTRIQRKTKAWVVPCWHSQQASHPCVPAKLLSHACLFVTLWTVAHKAILYMGILQARILEWVAVPSSRGSFPA